MNYSEDDDDTMEYVDIEEDTEKYVKFPPSLKLESTNLRNLTSNSHEEEKAKHVNFPSSLKIDTTSNLTSPPPQIKKEISKRIFFDEKLTTFRLYPGNSLYSFCLSPELSLEHLYWGKVLHPGFDLRYLARSTRVGAFNTKEVYNEVDDKNNHDDAGEIIIPETIEEIQMQWKSNKNFSSSPSARQQRRLENLTWRLMTMKTVCSKQSLTDYFDVDDDEDENEKLKKSPSSTNIRFLFPPFDSKKPITRTRSLSCGSGSASENEDSYKQHIPPSPIYTTPMNSTTNMNNSNSSFNKSNRFRTYETKAFDRVGGSMGKGELSLEYSDQGTGDFRSPSFSVLDNMDGCNISPLRYRYHNIIRGKEPMPDGLPGLRCNSEDEASTLIVTMSDISTGLEVDLIYVVIHDYDAVIRRNVIRNVDTRTQKGCSGKIIQRAFSSTLDFESSTQAFHLTQLSGSWARERHIIETKLTHGMQSFGSTRGVSGHQHNPFAAITIGPSSETDGEVKGFSLIYSGNYKIEAELSDIGRLRVNIGIHPDLLQWHLNSGIKLKRCINNYIL
jgi:hypothetical protein